MKADNLVMCVSRPSLRNLHDASTCRDRGATISDILRDFVWAAVGAYNGTDDRL